MNESTRYATALVMGRSCLACVYALALLAAVVPVGCSRPGPAVEFVEGKVLLDGALLADATIGFSPAEGAGLGAFGRTDAAGKYRLTSAGGGRTLAGAPIGSYIVTVRKYRNPLDDLGPRPAPDDPVAAGKWDAEAKRLGELPPESVIPVGYGEKSSSGLKATVKKGRNVGPEFRYELKGDFKGG
jgi:hypothetical protein